MSYTLTQSWKILLPLEQSSPNYLSEHKLFVVESGKSFLRKIGGGMEDYSIRPEVLRPTVVFHNALAKVAKNLGFSGKKFPYLHNGNSLNVTLHYYFEKYVVITITYKNDDIQTLKPLKEKATLGNYHDVKQLCLAIGGLIISGNHKQFSPLNTVPTYSCTSIKLNDASVAQLDNKELVESLTGHIDPTENMIMDVLSRNAGHQINSALTLIDKQGVLQQIPANYIGGKESLRKYESCCNIFELMLAMDMALKDGILDENKIFLQSLKNLVHFPEKIVYSFTARRTIEQFIRDFHFSNSTMALEESQNKSLQNKMVVKSKTLQDGWNEFYASKEFFAVIFTSIVAGITAGLTIFWAYLKAL